LGQSQHSGLESNAFFAATPSTMPAVEATETFPNKALFPQSNRIDTAAHPPTGLGLTVAGRQTQNDLRAHGLSHASAPSSGSTLQHFSLRRRNHDTFRHPLFLQQPPVNNQCNSALGLVFGPLFGSLSRGSTTCWFAYGKPIRDSIETCRGNAAPSLTSVPRVKISRIGLRDLLCFDGSCPKPLSNYSDSCAPGSQQRSARNKQ
jgi:hypothetical protein